jgi:hypothetical protein
VYKNSGLLDYTSNPRTVQRQALRASFDLPPCVCLSICLSSCSTACSRRASVCPSVCLQLLKRVFPLCVCLSTCLPTVAEARVPVVCLSVHLSAYSC